jgi:hypothetical protein
MTVIGTRLSHNNGDKSGGGRGTRTPKPLLATVFKTVGLPLSYSSGAQEKYVGKIFGAIVIRISTPF